MKLLTLLLSILDRLFSAWDRSQVRQEERQKIIREMNDEIDRQIALGEAVIVTPNPERDERLRSRFDRASSGE
jgi:hypothetical protein